MIHKFLAQATGEEWTASNSQTAGNNRWFKNVPAEAVSFTLCELADLVTPTAKAAIEKLATQVTNITGQTNPVITLELGPSMFAEMREAWRPLVDEHLTEQKLKHLTSVKSGVRKAMIKQTPGPNPISSPCKENENENNNKHESSSYNSPPSVAPQGSTHSGERRHNEVRRLPASLHSLSSTPPPSPPPSPSYLLSFAHLSPFRVQMNATIEKLYKTVQRAQDVIRADIKSGTTTTLAAYQVESEKSAAENDKHAAEREKAEEERAAAKVHRAAQSAAAEESIRHQEAKRDAKVEAQIAEMKAKAAEQVTARIAARKAEEAKEAEDAKAIEAIEAERDARKLKKEKQEEEKATQKAQMEEERSTLHRCTCSTRCTRCTRCTLYLRTSTILTLLLCIMPAGTKPRTSITLTLLLCTPPAGTNPTYFTREQIISKVDQNKATLDKSLLSVQHNCAQIDQARSILTLHVLARACTRCTLYALYALCALCALCAPAARTYAPMHHAP